MSTESLNRFLYSSKLRAYALMRRTTYTLTVAAVGLLIYAHGVEQDPVTLNKLYRSIDAILSIFVFIYLLRILYAFERIEFLKRTWFEGILIGVIFLNEFSTYVLDYPFIYNLFEGIGVPLSVEIYCIVVSLYMLVLLVIELLETRVHPQSPAGKGRYHLHYKLYCPHRHWHGAVYAAQDDQRAGGYTFYRRPFHGHQRLLHYGAGSGGSWHLFYPLRAGAVADAGATG